MDFFLACDGGGKGLFVDFFSLGQSYQKYGRCSLLNTFLKLNLQIHNTKNMYDCLTQQLS